MGSLMGNYKLKEERIKGEKTKKIYDSIKSMGSISLKEITKKTGVNYNTVRGAVQKLQKMGLIKRVSRGLYELVKES